LRTLSLRLSALFIALLIAAALAVAYVFDRGRADLLEQRQREQLRRHAESASSEVGGFIYRLQGDVMFLAHTPPIQGIRRALEGGGTDMQGGSSLGQWEERLEQIFLALAKARPEYFKIRLIGTRDSGRELVRIERKQGELGVTQRAALQRQGDRYYFREVASLPSETFYLSRIDLTREQGGRSIPYQPTLRAATPLYGPAGDLFAILVVNMDMGYAFRRARSFVAEEESLYIADEGGGFLLHPQPGRAFANERGESFQLTDAFPDQAPQISAVTPGAGILLPLRNRRIEQAAFVTSRAWDPREPERRLLFIVTEPMEQLREAVGLLRRDSLLWVSGLLSLAIGLVIMMVRRATGSLSTLAAASVAIAKGDYAVELPAPDRTEVGTLVGAFRRMVDEVEHREEALAQLNRDLEQRVAERTRELSRQHDLQRLILDNIADGVVVTDREGHFILWNQKAEQIVGSGPEDVPPEHWSSHFGLYRDESGEPVRFQDLPLVRAIQGQSIDNAELYLRHPSRYDGRWTQVTARPLRDSQGCMAGAVAVLVDVTDQKRLQARLQVHRAELVKLGQMVLGAEVASAAAHELSQPIAAICNYAAAAVRLRAQGRLGEEELRSMLARIEHLSAQAGEILDRLRSRIRRREPRSCPFDLNDIVSSCLDYFGERIHREGVKVRRHFGIELPPLMGDPLELEHALIQLVTNALDAMEATARERRRLSVKTDRTAAPRRVVVQIEDTGPGISPSVARRLFEPWESNKPGALGIGLTIAQTIVEDLGGHIRIEAANFGGARFCVELPVSTRPSR
jgi:PAS domain S-box-containing protein